MCFNVTVLYILLDILIIAILIRIKRKVQQTGIVFNALLHNINDKQGRYIPNDYYRENCVWLSALWIEDTSIY